jgi:hypothetical protein
MKEEAEVGEYGEKEQRNMNSTKAGTKLSLRKGESLAWFISLTFAPLQMRAPFGESSRSLQETARVRVDEAIKMLAQSGGLMVGIGCAACCSKFLDQAHARRVSEGCAPVDNQAVSALVPLQLGKVKSSTNIFTRSL